MVSRVRNGLIGLALSLFIASAVQASGLKPEFCELTDCPGCYAYANCTACWTSGFGCFAQINGVDCWDYDCHCTGGGTICDCSPPCPGGGLVAVDND